MIQIMPKAKTQAPQKPRKRGRKEVRLVITDDPTDAIKRLLKAQKPAAKR